MNARTKAILGAHAWTYRQQFTSCGKCVVCRAGGYVHGPYWYAFRKDGAATRSLYVGRRLPPRSVLADSALVTNIDGGRYRAGTVRRVDREEDEARR